MVKSVKNVLSVAAVSPFLKSTSISEVVPSARRVTITQLCNGSGLLSACFIHTKGGKTALAAPHLPPGETGGISQCV